MRHCMYVCICMYDVCMYVCMCVCMYVCTYLYAYTYVCMYTFCLGYIAVYEAQCEHQHSGVYEESGGCSDVLDFHWKHEGHHSVPEEVRNLRKTPHITSHHITYT